MLSSSVFLFLLLFLFLVLPCNTMRYGSAVFPTPSYPSPSLPTPCPWAPDIETQCAVLSCLPACLGDLFLFPSFVRFLLCCAVRCGVVLGVKRSTLVITSYFSFRHSTSFTVQCNEVQHVEASSQGRPFSCLSFWWWYSWKSSKLGKL